MSSRVEEVPQMDDVEKELDAMNKIYAALIDLNPDIRSRILAWMTVKFSEKT